MDVYYKLSLLYLFVGMSIYMAMVNLHCVFEFPEDNKSFVGMLMLSGAIWLPVVVCVLAWLVCWQIKRWAGG